MGPVRIKYWGLMWLTKPTYLVLQSIALFLCAVLTAIGLWAVLVTDRLLPQVPPGLMDVLIGMFWAVGLIAFPLECVETYVMLRKFARAEAELQAKLAALDDSEPAPFAPSSTALQSPTNVSPPNTNIQP
jgi:hypothetical protein